MKSLRRTIIVWLTLLLTGVAVLATVASYEFGLSEAGEFMDDQLRQVASLADGELGAVSDPTSLSEPEDHFVFVVWDKGGRLLFAAPNPPRVTPPSQTGFATFEAQGVAWRSYVERKTDRTIMVAQLMSARDEIAQHSALAVAIPILAVVPLVWLVVILTVGRVLEKLAGLSLRIAERGVDSQDPLPLVGLPSEIRPVVSAMNVLIERLQAALRQQRRFIADSAHELRTPLAALRIQIDTLPLGDGTETTAAALQDGITRASAVLNQLLRLARFDGLETRGAPESLDLSELLTQCVADAVAIAEDAGIDIGVTIVEPVVVQGVKADIQLLLSNVIDNAIRYTPPAGLVDCMLRSQPAGALIEIVDTGPGVAEALIPRLTDRFFRAAGPETMGSGLGLAIVKAIADLHKLTLSITNRPDRSGLAVAIRFPSVNPAPRFETRGLAVPQAPGA